MAIYICQVRAEALTKELPDLFVAGGAFLPHVPFELNSHLTSHTNNTQTASFETSH